MAVSRIDSLQNLTSGVPSSTKMKKVALVGLPNTGKSQIFNNLTGEYNVVANYPGTTIEMKRSVTRIKDQFYEIIDTPGLHCLYIHSEEEIAVRDMILAEAPDVIVQCIDASEYKQSFLLTADLLELETPLVLVLNYMDETQQKGIQIDSAKLEQTLGVPVVESIALKGLGKDQLRDAIVKARRSTLDVKYGFQLEHAITDLAAELPFELEFKHKIALLLMLGDPFMEKYLEKRCGIERTQLVRMEAAKARGKIRGNIRQVINNRRGRWTDQISAAVVKRQIITPHGFSHHFTQASRHPLLGIPILLMYVAIVYFSVVYISEWLETALEFFITKPVTGMVTALALPSFWNDLLVGSYGILTLGLFNAVCTVLPIMLVFFFVFGFFEDSGYIANFCVLSKNVCEKIGVPGKAITPLILGFSCRTMAVLSARGLTSFKEKFISIFLISFAVPCSAQLGLSIAILGRSGASAFVIAFGALWALALASGFLLNTIIRKDTDSFFIQGLPDVHMPNLKAVSKKTWHRILEFLREAIPIFVFAAIVLFTLEKTGVLSLLKNALSPIVVSWVGLPANILDVLVLSLASRAAAAGLTIQMVDAGALNYIQAIVTVVLTTTFFPCFANMFAIGKEMGWKTALTMAALILTTSFVFAGLFHGALVLILKS